MKTPERAGRPALARRMRPAILPLALSAVLATGNAWAARLDYQLELTGLHSDNINLSENNQATESTLIPSLMFDFREEGASLEVRARGEIERRYYSDDRFDDETRSRFAGQLNWSVFPQRMHIVLEDYLSEESLNFRDGRYPGNLQQVNIFLGGPSFYARFNDATRLQLDVRAADTYAEVAEGFDSKRYSAAAVLQHDINETSNASLHLGSTRVDFDDGEAATDYTRHDGFVRYEGRFRDVDYQLDLGRSRLNRNAADDVSTTIARAQAQWQINRESRLRIRARHHFADEVQDLIVRLGDPDEALVPELVDSSSTLVSGGVYRQRDVELDYRFSGERFTFRVRPRDRQFRYLENVNANRTERGALVQVTYRLNPLTSLVFNGTVRKRDFVSGEEDRDHVYSIGIEQQRTRHWGWRAEALRNRRTSNQPDPEYTENAVLLSVWWKR
ncbi:hypothetical protein [Lysobacter solisilvae (ex Woo and Kim 2020)]|uniref:TIGR03016 family PEP-CTERM system-associated outer membrane protein n=1 Tax=Agrilutibacter terrestris TaxID=2865112 RepID=A0A7H0FXD2_9GAMM|nr:hypothetical protein [Lysobacter terrestris]QNP40698.1 hypothetical protein H8B22_00035 [Lysobacter terrestris]